MEMAFTAQDVKTLRERTGVGMMDCKKALTESGGDMDKAIDILREKGLAAAAKKSGRIAAEGMVYATVDEAKKVGVVVEVNAETDFVAKNADFQQFVKDVASVIIEKNPSDVEALLALPFSCLLYTSQYRLPGEPERRKWKHPHTPWFGNSPEYKGRFRSIVRRRHT